MMWVAFNKPMRWRDPAGAVIPLPGQSNAQLDVQLEHSNAGNTVNDDAGTPLWQDRSDSVSGYRNYRDDAFTQSIRFSSNELESGSELILSISVQDLVGQALDADPATPVDWSDGHWVAYEDNAGAETDSGGNDRTLSYTLGGTNSAEPFTIEPGTSAALFDVDRNGEGFLFEVLADQRANVYWFTYDEQGRPRWLVGNGIIEGNRVVIESFLEPVNGTEFGPNFDPDEIELSSAGRSEFLFSGCAGGAVSFKAPSQRKLRHQLSRLTDLSGVICGTEDQANDGDAISGSWFEPATTGQGFVVQRLPDNRGVVYWFTYDPNGAPYWISGIGPIEGSTLQIDEALVFSGPQFGQAYDPSALQSEVWGSLTLSFDCSEASADYASVLPQFGSGSIDLIRLTQIAGLNCEG